jgi:hypothetical protein
MLSYGIVAGFLVFVCGLAIIVDQATRRHDERPIDAEDYPECGMRVDQRFRQADGQ